MTRADIGMPIIVHSKRRAAVLIAAMAIGAAQAADGQSAVAVTDRRALPSPD